MKLQSLTIVFENCDSITIDSSNIRGFALGNIVEEVILVAGKKIVQNKRAMMSYLALDLTDLPHEVQTKICESYSITHYLINREHRKRLEYAVVWGEEEFTNTLEKHEINEDGYLTIEIA